jgi:hypothetical protein
VTDVKNLIKVLSVERNLLEYVLYRLVAAKLVLSTNDQRYVMQSLVEVQDAVDRLRSVAFRREELMKNMAQRSDTPLPRFTLSVLADHAPTAERFMLIELQSDYVRLAHQIDQISSENRRLAELSLGPTADLLKQLAGVPTGTMYDGGGGRTNGIPSPVHLDEVI